MNGLEQYIRDNKSLFDEEPETGHFERMQQKMNRNRHRINLFRWSTGIAASLVVLVSVGILWTYSGQTGNVAVICETSEDMKYCYLDKMNAVAGQIEELTKDMDVWDREQVNNDVQNIIEAVGSDFENEIPEELNEEATRSILSDYYQRNLESLNMIAKTLENKK